MMDKNTVLKLTPMQKVEYFFLMALLFVVPISWEWATKITAILMVIIPIKIIVEKGGNLQLNKYPQKKFYLLFMVTYLLYVVSMVYTSNVAEGLQNLEKKLSFIIFPLFFLLSNLSYLTPKRTKALFYSFLCGTLFFVVGNLLWATYDYLFLQAPFSRFLGREVTKIHYIHHTYIAMYCCFAIVYSFVQLFGSDVVSKSNKVFLSVVVVLSALFVVLVESRAGILCMAVLFVFLFAWLFFVKKKRALTMYCGTALVVIMTAFFIVFPSGLNRIVKTGQNLVDTEQKEDIRITLLKAGVDVAQENLLIGVGVGDRCDKLIEHYEKNNLQCGDLNSHNQFVDTTISIGILGLLSLIGYFVLPIVLAIRNRQWNIEMLLFLFIIAFNAVFEAVFESQTGILFFNIIFCLLFYASFVSKKELQSYTHDV
ncbi:MAG: O-antigen ligase family protein [Bacteroidales bacterium]|nr:O-antigen ligase family protein [Bacteroidales bacterium]